MTQRLRSRDGHVITVRNADAAKRWEARGYTLVEDADEKPRRTARKSAESSEKGSDKS